MKSLFFSSMLFSAALAPEALAAEGAAPAAVEPAPAPVVPAPVVPAPAAEPAAAPAPAVAPAPSAGVAETASGPRLDQPIAFGTAAGAATPHEFELPDGLKLVLSARIAGTVDWAGAAPLDAAGTKSAAGLAVSPLLRLGLKLSGPQKPGALNYVAEYEHDLPTGTVAGGTLPEGPGMPGGAGLSTQLRKASLQVSYGNAVIVRGGVMTSHFGLGLVSNDGAHGWEPGSARFADPRGGDRVLRGLVATGPHTALGLVAALAVDKILDDDTLLLTREMSSTQAKADDSARQFVGLVSLGNPAENWAGVFLAHRNQTAGDGRTLAATVASVSGLGRRTLASGGVLSGGIEGVVITGETNLPGTASHPVQQVMQTALALRGGLDLSRYGFALDALAASGDSNLDDDQQRAFRADPNYELGLLLFRQVLAAQSARSSFTAGNPDLVGAPAPGVERLPTRGSVTNTVTVFPRAFVRPLQGVEIYGGPLFAWSAVPPIDPFNTRVNGGSVRNALGGKPGSYLGTELDVGVRARFLFGFGELAAGVEGGLLLPGAALNTADGTPMASVPGARAVLALHL